jgi:O-antigen ligase
MIAVLAVLAAAAAWLTPLRERAVPSPPATADPARTTAPAGSARPAESQLPSLRWAAIGTLVLALVITGIAVTRVERTGAGPAQGANPSRLVSAQSNRYEYWRVAVDAFADAPLKGGGSGSFRTVWLRERTIEETVRDAHSLYFETAAELGLVGLLALIAFVAGIVVMARRSVGAAGAIGALAVFAIHAGLDWDWEMPALTLVALTLAARLATPDARRDTS